MAQDTDFQLVTERLLVRIMRPEDIEVFLGYRAYPEIAKYEPWEYPYPREKAEQLLENQRELTGLNRDGWTQCAVEQGGQVIGDLAVRLEMTPDHSAGSAEIGYTIAPEHQGNGYATEGTIALIQYLIEELGVVRVHASLDPENIASQRVLERSGLVYEVLARNAYLLKGEWVDDLVYSTTADAWRAWRDRPTTTPAIVALIPITSENQRAYARLTTHASQQRLVATVAQSYADALLPPDEDGAPLRPVLFGIEADGHPVGFLMYADVTSTVLEPYLWRLLIDRNHQRRGIGGRALDQLIEQLKVAGHHGLLVSWVPGPGSPERWYRRRGFVTTGRIDDDGEVEARLAL